MPTYEYACRDCGEHLEVVQSFKDDALTVCPNCEGSLRKVFSAAGIIFKGSGWHVKDYAGAGKPAAAGSSSNGDGAGDSSSSDAASSDAPASSSTDSSSTTSTSTASSSTTDAKPAAAAKAASTSAEKQSA
jgi:putative FmdB family regulatory protein